MLALQNPTDSFDPMEAKLQAILRPIHPSRQFVQTVRQRIQIASPIQVKLAEKSSETRRFLLAMGGVLSVSLLLITGVRAIFYLVNRSRS